MTNKELELISKLTEIAVTVAELKAENKILKEVNEKLMQVLPIHDIVEQDKQLLALAQYMFEHQNNLDGKTAKDYLQDFLNQ